MDQSIEKWLDSLGMHQYAPAFRDSDIDWQVLRELDHELLKEIGVESVGHRVRLLSAIRRLAEQADPLQQTQTNQHVDAADVQGKSERYQTGMPGDAVAEGLERAQADKPVVSQNAERRQLTVMFCDLVGSTAMSEELDPEDLRELVRAYQQLVDAHVAPFDGHIAQYLGDGVLVYFGYPLANEDDAQRAVHAALAITREMAKLEESLGKRLGVDISVRIGLHTGPVVVGLMGGGARTEQLAMGATPNQAARLQALAEPDQVVISDATLSLLGGRFETSSLGGYELKGVSGLTVPHIVLRERRTLSRFVAGYAAHAMAGRSGELTALTDHWQAARVGHGRCVVLTGEAGIGKSRLCQELIDRVGNGGGRVVLWQCQPHYTNTALYPATHWIRLQASLDTNESPAVRIDSLHQWLKKDAGRASTARVDERLNLIARLLDLNELADERFGSLSMSRTEQQARLTACLQAMIIGSQAKPTLFVLEDAHWSDPTTIKFVDSVVETVTDSATLALVTGRPTFTHGFGGHRAVHRQALNRLDQRSVRSIIERIANGTPVQSELVDRIVAQSDGVPLFAEEIARSVLEDGQAAGGTEQSGGDSGLSSVPSTLQDSLMARLDRLGEAKRIAQVAACYGRVFRQSRLERVFDDPGAANGLEHALRQLVDAELIQVLDVGAGGAVDYQFRHALLGDVAYNSLLRDDRKRLHAAIAGDLCRNEPNVVKTDPAMLAQHHEMAGQAQEAVQCRRDAAEQAYSRLALQESLEHLECAIRLVPELPEANRLDVELDLQLRFGRSAPELLGFGHERETEAIARAFELARFTSDENARLTAYIARARALNTTGYPKQAIEVCGELKASLSDMNADVRDRLMRAASLQYGMAYSIAANWGQAREMLESALAFALAGRVEQHAETQIDMRDGLFGGKVRLNPTLSLPAIYTWLGEVYRATGQFVRYRQMIDEEYKVAKESKDPLAIGNSLVMQLIHMRLEGKFALLPPRIDECRAYLLEHKMANRLALMEEQSRMLEIRVNGDQRIARHAVDRLEKRLSDPKRQGWHMLCTQAAQLASALDAAGLLKPYRQLFVDAAGLLESNNLRKGLLPLRVVLARDLLSTNYPDRGRMELTGIFDTAVKTGEWTAALESAIDLLVQSLAKPLSSKTTTSDREALSEALSNIEDDQRIAIITKAKEVLQRADEKTAGRVR